MSRRMMPCWTSRRLLPTLALLAVGTLAWGGSPSTGRAFDAIDVPARAADALAEQTPRTIDDFRAIQEQVQRVLPQVLAATVGVQANRSAGSGVVIDREGHVLTAAHVIGRPGRRVFVTLSDGRRLAGRSLGADHDEDAGLIKLDAPPADLPFLPVNWDQAPLAGEWVVATGQPGGIVNDRAPPLRLGRILFVEHDVICTDATLVGGDSGGPLCNMHGEVVAIHSSIGPRTSNNFHVPATAFRQVWDRLLASDLWGGRYDEETDEGNEGRPLLGLAGRTDGGQCLITQVFPGMPAEQAGLRPGDVVVATDDRPLESFEKLIDIVALKRPGQRMKLTLKRDETELQVEVLLAGIGKPLPGSPAPRSSDNGP
ncbi:MAG: trypsin-like peptidase domain-containing protein, partial [Planctomycetales bacterium]|nr:trypsin-like peptidase domain-containing protein [Planctomycetales bacterium]